MQMSEFQNKKFSYGYCSCKIMWFKRKKIFKSLKKIKDVDGRLELARRFPNNIKVFIDYAHTPDALSKSFTIFRTTIW